MHYYSDPKFWLAISFAIFFALLYKYVVPLLVKIIDKKSKTIQNKLLEIEKTLNDAKSIRGKSQRLYKLQLDKSEEIIREAKNEANNILKTSRLIVENEIDKKIKIEEEKVKQEEKRMIKNLKQCIISDAINNIQSRISESRTEQINRSILISSINNISKIIH